MLCGHFDLLASPLCFLKCRVRAGKHSTPLCLIHGWQLFKMSVIHTAFGRTSGLHPESCAAECRGNKKKGTMIQPCNREGGHFESFFFLLFFFFFNVKAIHQSLIQHSSISVVAYIRKRGTAQGWDLEISLLWSTPHFKTGCSPPPRQQRELVQSNSMEEWSSWEM